MNGFTLDFIIHLNLAYKRKHMGLPLQIIIIDLMVLAKKNNLPFITLPPNQIYIGKMAIERPVRMQYAPTELKINR